MKDRDIDNVVQSGIRLQCNRKCPQVRESEMSLLLRRFGSVKKVTAGYFRLLKTYAIVSFLVFSALKWGRQGVT